MQVLKIELCSSVPASSHSPNLSVKHAIQAHATTQTGHCIFELRKNHQKSDNCCNLFAQVQLNYKKFPLAGSDNRPLGLYFLFFNFPLFKQSFTINQTNHFTYISY